MTDAYLNGQYWSDLKIMAQEVIERKQNGN